MKASTPIRVIASLGVSAGLLAWLVYRVSPQALAHAAAEVDWRLLAPATVAMVFALYFWDAVCLPIVYRVDDNRWSYWRSLHLRGLSYLAGSLHYELGQAALAWGMARTQNTSVVRMLSRSVLLAVPRRRRAARPRLRRIAVQRRPARRAHAAARRDCVCCRDRDRDLCFGCCRPHGATKVWGTKIDELFAGWSLARSLQLIPLRCVYFSIFAVYAAVALAICHVPVDHQVVASTIPLVLARRRPAQHRRLRHARYRAAAAAHARTTPKRCSP